MDGTSTKHKFTLTGALAASVAERPDESPKQRLVILADKGLLNPLQLRALSERLDALRKEKRDDAAALGALAAEYDGGEVRIEGTSAKAIRPPTLFDCPKGESAKQCLIWMMERGTLSLVEVQRVAAELAKRETEQKTAVDRDGMAVLLFEMELFNALPANWSPEQLDEKDEEESAPPPAPSAPAAPRASRPTGRRATPPPPPAAPKEETPETAPGTAGQMLAAETDALASALAKADAEQVFTVLNSRRFTDAELTALAEAESGGQARPEVLAAIEERQAAALLEG
jgi:hypothetical protein